MYTIKGNFLISLPYCNNILNVALCPALTTHLSYYFLVFWRQTIFLLYSFAVVVVLLLFFAKHSTTEVDPQLQVFTLMTQAVRCGKIRIQCIQKNQCQWLPALLKFEVYCLSAVLQDQLHLPALFFKLLHTNLLGSILSVIHLLHGQEFLQCPTLQQQIYLQYHHHDMYLS